MDQSTWSFVVDHVRDVYVPPGLRGALFEVAAGLPGVEVQRNVHDAVGRSGVAVRMHTGAGWEELVFDPGDYRFLGSREGAAPSGPATYQFALVKVEVADRLPAHHFLPSGSGRR